MASFAGVYACALAILMLRPRNGNDATLALWYGTLSIYFFIFQIDIEVIFQIEERKVLFSDGSGEKEGIGMIEVDGYGWWLKLCGWKGLMIIIECVLIWK